MDFKHALKELLPDALTVVLATASGPEAWGVFNPNGNGVEEVIGHKFSTFAGYPGRNVVGPRATGDNVNLTDETGTVFLGPKILGADPSPDQRDDIAVCSAVEGAAAALLKIGREKGIIPPISKPPIRGVEPVVPGKDGESWPDQRTEVSLLKAEVEDARSLLDFVVSELKGEVSFLYGKAPLVKGGTWARQLRAERDFMDSLRRRIEEES